MTMLCSRLQNLETNGLQDTGREVAARRRYCYSFTGYCDRSRGPASSNA